MKEVSPAGRAVLIISLMLTQTIGWGTTYSQISILAAPIVEELGLARSQVFLGATLLYVFAALTAARAGRLADRFGGLLFLIPGSIVMALSLWALSRAEGLASYLWPWMLIGAVFHIGLVTSAYAGLVQVLGKRASSAIAILTIATGLCSSIFWPLSEWLLGTTDWRGVLQIYAALMLFLVAPIHVCLWLRFGRRRTNTKEDGAPPDRPRVEKGQERRAQHLMIVIASLGSLITVGFGVTAIEVFTSLGTPRSEAVFAGALMGPAYVLSRVLSMFLERWLTPASLATIVYAALPLSICPLLPYALTGTPLPGWVAACMAFGFGLPAGLVGLVKSLLPLYLFGSDGYGARLGLQARATETASAIAPFGFTMALGLSTTSMLSMSMALGGVAFLAAIRLSSSVQAHR